MSCSSILQGRGWSGRETGTWKVPAGVPDMRAKNIIVAAFNAPAMPTLETVMATLPRGAELTVICPEDVEPPKGNFKVNMVKGMCWHLGNKARASASKGSLSDERGNLEREVPVSLRCGLMGCLGSKLHGICML